MSSDFIAFEASSENDPDGAKLRHVLGAHFAHERVRARRVVLVHWLAALSLPVWLAALRPGWPSPGSRRLLLAAWILSAVLAGASLFREWRWRVRRDREAADIRAELPPSP